MKYCNAKTNYFSLLFSCANVLGFLVRETGLDVKQMTIVCSDSLYDLKILNLKKLVRLKFSFICALLRKSIMNYLLEMKC